MKNSLLALAALLLCACARSGQACFNDERPQPPPPEDIMKALTTRPQRQYWVDQAASYKARPPIASDWQNLNSYAVALAHIGQNEQAFKILQDVEARLPGHYPTAANIGTVYELLGKNAEALRWIQEGIKRNPRSHQGSEWLHVRILEAKIALAKDKNWLKSHSVTGLDFGDGSTPESATILPTGNEGQALSADEVANALKYQLHERLEFIKPPEPVVSELLSDLADFHSLKHSPEAARPIYEMAWSYGSAHPQVLQSRIEAAGGHIGLPIWLKVLLLGGVSALIVLKAGSRRKGR